MTTPAVPVSISPYLDFILLSIDMLLTRRDIPSVARGKLTQMSGIMSLQVPRDSITRAVVGYARGCTPHAKTSSRVRTDAIKNTALRRLRGMSIIVFIMPCRRRRTTPRQPPY